MKVYGTYVFGQSDIPLSDHLTDYVMQSEESADGGVHYVMKAKFKLDTPIGDILPFLEAGGSVTYTRDGVQKRILLEVIEDGLTRTES